MTDKVHENRVRRMAKRQRLELVKTRRIDFRAFDYGTYSLHDARNKVVARLDHVSLDEIEAYLTDDSRFGGTNKRRSGSKERPKRK